MVSLILTDNYCMGLTMLMVAGVMGLMQKG
jgi:hypothetical protein